MSTSHIALCRLAIQYAEQSSDGDLKSKLEMFRVYVEKIGDLPQRLAELLQQISNGTADAEVFRRFYLAAGFVPYLSPYFWGFQLTDVSSDFAISCVSLGIQAAGV
jgi:hypothetical protein